MIPFNAPPREPWRLDPDDLRDQVQMAFSTICVADSKRFCQRMLKGLENAGVHVGSSLLMLGIPANGDEDLTPSDMGKLLRYIRFNSPAAIEALAGPLSELFLLKREPRLAAQQTDEAA
jgi:hypothetical protein